MIKYQLTCHHGHEFEAWFRSSETFEVQAATGAVECPICGSLDVSKAVMAPQIAKLRPQPNNASSQPATIEEPAPPSGTSLQQNEVSDILRKFRAEVEARSEYVGRALAREARDMHFDDKPKRSIWGEATREEVRELLEDDVPVVPLPRLPEDAD